MTESVIVCAQTLEHWAVRRRKCPYCGRRARILVEACEWCDPEFTCLSCGDAWTWGERQERPFCPGWRRKRIDKALARLARYRARKMERETP